MLLERRGSFKPNSERTTSSLFSALRFHSSTLIIVNGQKGNFCYPGGAHCFDHGLKLSLICGAHGWDASRLAVPDGALVHFC